jgi:AAA+ ATPase superfamily predicted ATPase
MKAFVNRKDELAILDQCQKRGGGLVILYGRRRVGKTALLQHWLGKRRASYSQAIEGNPLLQVDQISCDIGEAMGFPIRPKSWSDFFSLLKRSPGPWILCIDEFQYLAESSRELPSMVQKFIDHSLPKGSILILAGSSQSLMHGLVTDSSQPLYGRSELTMKIEPMGYRYFCEALELKAKDLNSLVLYTMTGGLPRYWKFLERLPALDPITVAESLYFESGSVMEDEPERILKDEGALGNTAKSILECVGRGCHKMSEIGGRLGQPATNLSRPMKLLVDLGFIHRDTPFNASERDSKLSFYRLADPALLFWFGTYSPMRSRWPILTTDEKLSAIYKHAGDVLEKLIRDRYPNARRYWEGDFEWDSVREVSRGQIIVSEVKFGRLSKPDRTRIVKSIEAQFERSSLRRYKLKSIEVIDSFDAMGVLG